MANNIVKFWRGSRESYDALVKAGKADFWTRYSVKESDGRRNEYFGTLPVSPATGELYPVKDIVTSLPTSLNTGDRYLVGDDTNGYYVVEIAANLSQSVIKPLGELSVRVESHNYYRYQYVNGKLTTYDNGIDCGTY